MKNSNIDLSNLTDKQKSLLSQLSYLEINISKYSEMLEKNSNVTISDLSKLLEDNGNNKYLGNIAKSVTGIDTTEKELISELEREGLGNLQINNITNNEKTGFSGIAFSDGNGNTGMSFRGTQMNDFGELMSDAITDVNIRITGNDSQVIDAKNFYENNKSQSGNYLYGHSLGGNLVEQVYCENFNDIDNAFAINALPIDEDLINTQEKINAFNNSEKFNCYVIGGDWVSELDSYEKYSGNVKYIQNNGTLKDNMFSNHTIEAASYNDNGNFLLSDSKEQAYKKNQSFFQKAITGTIKTFSNIFEKVYDVGKNFFGNIKDFFGDLKNKFLPDNNPKMLSTPQSSYLDSLKLENFQTNQLGYNPYQALENINHPKDIIANAQQNFSNTRENLIDNQEEEFTIHSGHERYH